MTLKSMRGINPVLDREIRERMRSGRSIILVALMVLILGAILYLVYYMSTYSLSNQGFLPGGFTAASIGRLMFEWLLLFELLLITFIAPGVSAGAIVGERERRTLNILQLTQLTPRSIAVGKLMASTSFLLLLIVATAPLFTVPLVLGGVSIWQVVKALIVACSYAVLLSAMGLYLSSVARRIQFSIVAAYVVLFLATIGLWVLFGLEMFGQENGTFPAGRIPMSAYINPVVAAASAVTEPDATTFGPAPFTSLARGLFDSGRRFQAVEDMVIRPQEAELDPNDQPVWLIFSAVCMLATAGLLALTSLRLRLPAPILTVGRKG